MGQLDLGCYHLNFNWESEMFDKKVFLEIHIDKPKALEILRKNSEDFPTDTMLSCAKYFCIGSGLIREENEESNAHGLEK